MEWPSMAELRGKMASSLLGIVDEDRFCESLKKARRNDHTLTQALKRTLFLESWLRHLTVYGLTGLVAHPTTLVFSRAEGPNASVQRFS